MYSATAARYAVPISGDKWGKALGTSVPRDMAQTRVSLQDWSRGGSDSSQIKCLRRGADNAAANCGLN
jgi:hypothetical protein